MQDNKDLESTQENSMSRWSWFVVGSVAGLAVAYFWDPARGSYRRHLARDKFFKWTKHSSVWARRVSKDFRNRVRGSQYRWKHPMSEHVDDLTLESRVRSEFGRRVRHTRSISTVVKDGVVTLSGPILKEEVKSLLKTVKAMPGVREVINRLDVHETSNGIPSLQGEGKSYLQ